MALSIATDLVDLSTCDALGSWSSGTLDNIMQIQGTGCIGLQVKNTLGPLVTLPITSANMAGKALFVWQQVSGLTDSKVNGGFRIYADDTSANTRTWYVGGGLANLGWNAFVVQPAVTGNENSGTLNAGAIDAIGVRFKTLTSVSGASTLNCFWDACRYGSYLQATSGATDGITLNNIYQVDSSSTYAYGVLIQGKSGAYICQAKILFGNISSGDCDFFDSQQILVFPVNSFVQAGFYELRILGNSGGTTNFTLTGSVLKSAGLAFILDASDTDIDTMILDGNTIVNCGSALFSSVAQITNNVFDTCGTIQPGTCTFTGNTVANSATRAVKIITGHATADNKYNDNAVALWFDTAGTYTIDGDQFSGNTYDVENSSSGLVTINVVGGSNLSTYTNTGGGTTSIVLAPVTTTIKAIDAVTKANVVGSRVYLVAEAGGPLSEGTVIFNEVTDVNGEVEDIRSLASSQPVSGRIRMGTSTPFYKTYNLSGTINSTAGLSIVAQLIKDE